MLNVVSQLFFTTAIRFIESFSHRFGYVVSEHDHLTANVPGRPADRLNERTRRPQKAFLICIQDRHQRNLGQVQPLAQKIDADQYIELALA